MVANCKICAKGYSSKFRAQYCAKLHKDKAGRILNDPSKTSISESQDKLFCIQSAPMEIQRNSNDSEINKFMQFPDEDIHM